MQSVASDRNELIHCERDFLVDILLVDDSKTMRMLIQRALRGAGFRSLQVGEACNGVDAIDQLKKQQPKLVLSDWNMPEMSGIDLLRTLRHSGSSVPFGFITSEASEEIRSCALESGALFVITKPFTSDSLYDVLSPVLER